MYPSTKPTENSVDLRPCATLVLYTDGLVERRDRPVLSGLDELLGVLDRVRPEPPDVLVESLTREMVGDARRADDVCVLAVRLPARPRPRPRPSP